jgi:hypothetical protein
LCYHDHMKPSIRDNTTTRRQRPPQPGELIGVRLQPEPLAAVDRWRRRQEDLPSRAEAIRRLVEQALTSTDTRPTKPEAQQKAAEMAAHEIDKLSDRDMPDEERVQRKRRLIKGPREFRDIRSTRSKQ